MIGRILANFFSTCHPDASYRFWSQLAHWFRRRSKKWIFKMAPWQPSWISDQNNFSYFSSTSRPDASYQASSLLAFRFRRRSEKQMFKIATTVAIWISHWNNFSYFWSTSRPDASYLRKFDIDKAENVACRVFTSNLDNQGDITLPLLVHSDPFSNSSEIICMLLLSASFMKIQ